MILVAVQHVWRCLNKATVLSQLIQWSQHLQNQESSRSWRRWSVIVLRTVVQSHLDCQHESTECGDSDNRIRWGNLDTAVTQVTSAWALPSFHIRQTVNGQIKLKLVPMLTDGVVVLVPTRPVHVMELKSEDVSGSLILRAFLNVVTTVHFVQEASAVRVVAWAVHAGVTAVASDATWRGKNRC